MRLKQARIAPMTDAEMGPEQHEALKDFPPEQIVNLFRTLAHAPKALSRFNAWGGYVLSRRNDLAAREREIVCLRTGFLCRCGYEFSKHGRIGLRSGLSADDIARIKQGADAGWAPSDAVLIRAADELVRDQFITDATWVELRKHYSQKQCMDVVFTTGQYTQVSMILNTFGVQLENGEQADPDVNGF
jgi:4-carboxymuconolactone decarboxylase